MAEEKILYPETIQDNSLPFSNIPYFSSSSYTDSNVVKQEEIKDTEIPFNFSKEVISKKINSAAGKILDNFQFTASGAISIGKYENGVSGEIKISPNGIIATNKDGNTTLLVDGSTGNAVFSGEVAAGSVITGQVNVGNNNVRIDGVNKRIIINDGTRDIILIGYQQNGF